MSDKTLRFRQLHQGPGAFVMPNPWDPGSARILAGLGFQALATSSGACAGTLGRRDGKVTRDEALAHARAMVLATDLPVSADLEKGFGDSPAAAAGESPKPFSRSAETGRSVASTMARAWASASSRVTLPSRRPSVPAQAPLEVASAWKPRPARMRAEPGSQGLGITNAPGPWCSCRNRRVLSLIERP